MDFMNNATYRVDGEEGDGAHSHHKRNEVATSNVKHLVDAWRFGEWLFTRVRV